MWMTVADLNAEVGRRYRVEWDDCCTSGYFVSRLVDIDADEAGDLHALSFEHGEVTGGRVTLVEVEVQR